MRDEANNRPPEGYRVDRHANGYWAWQKIDAAPTDTWPEFTTKDEATTDAWNDYLAAHRKPASIELTPKELANVLTALRVLQRDIECGFGSPYENHMSLDGHKLMSADDIHNLCNKLNPPQ